MWGFLCVGIIPWTEEPDGLPVHGFTKSWTWLSGWHDLRTHYRYVCIQFSCLFSCQVVFNYLRPHGLEYARPHCPSPSPRVCPSSCSLNWWCHPTISSSVIPFSFCPQSFPASGSFLMSWLFTTGGHSTGASASASIVPMGIQDWSPSGWTGWISLQSNSLSRVFSNTTVQKHQFFGTQSSLWSSSHICTWLLERP